MRYSDQSYNLRIELDAKGCELTAADIAGLERRIDPLRELIAHFPVCDLYITVEHHARTGDYRVKTALVLSGRTLATGDEGKEFLSPFERSVRKLMHKVQAYEGSLSATPALRKHTKGTAHDLSPGREPDAAQLAEAIEQGDYDAFRRACFMYEEPVRSRAGRWINRYPEAEARLEVDLALDDIVEEVFLNAFERFADRPESVRLGEWLEGWIDPSIKLLLHDPQEQENVSFARSARESSS